MDYQQYISADHRIMLGKPTITGTRITVELILERLATGSSINDLLAAYPHLNTQQIQAAIAYAASVVAAEEMIKAA